jgi:hypothetical protein
MDQGPLEDECHSYGQEIPTLYVTQKLITTFTRAPATGPYPEPAKSISLLSSHLCLSLQNISWSPF